VNRLIELSRDERRIVIFLCLFLLAGSLYHIVRIVFPGFAAMLGFESSSEIEFVGLTPADSLELEALIERAMGGVEREVPSFPLDLNEAGPGELELLPGIGAVKARAIVDLRDSLGGFRRVDQLMKVKGIGPKTLEKLLPYITVRP